MAEATQSWSSGFMDNTMDIFGKLAGTYLEYERIQHGVDASGKSQSAVINQPEKENQVTQLNPQQPAPSGGLLAGPQVYYVMGGLAFVGLILLAKK
ncbi:hypothetical protein [Photobacterium arenosum]|uniref:hypothetical protein n=1 Tax=Photobacterium arenosum TaxID=2774143 RepID=UPI00288A0181|nr:hypothetical protein [Photobacterium arenosum]